MYVEFFKLGQPPFSIAPDPRYLYMSERHREALAHLLYGINSGGGFVLLTGEIGAGKTTVCRCLLEQIPANCKVAYIFNPKLSVIELLQSICEEFHVSAADDGKKEAPESVKAYVDRLNSYLLASHAAGNNNVLIIDEAQNLSADVLEQLRLLTNLETNERKLLQIILIGQPELRDMLARRELEQLAQRVIARYHLDSLSEPETARYIQHRLGVAGLSTASPFQPQALETIFKITHGVPRRINLLCDLALLGAYVEDKLEVDSDIVRKAAREIFGGERNPREIATRYWPAAVAGIAAGVLLALAAGWMWSRNMGTSTAATVASVQPDRTVLAPTATLDDLSRAPGVGARDANLALRQLAALWNARLEDGDACRAALKLDLHCYQGEASLAELRSLNRPAMLLLKDDGGKSYHALLAGITGSIVDLRIDGAARSVSLAILDRHYQGAFTSLWRAPANYREKLRRGYRGADVDWLAAQLAKSKGMAAPTADHPLDGNTISLLKKFQAEHGLKADGVAGPKTFMHLNSVAGIGEPQLSAKPAIASAAAASVAGK
ncbi:ExeA family protein [soil metagenome]